MAEFKKLTYEEEVDRAVRVALQGLQIAVLDMYNKGDGGHAYELNEAIGHLLNFDSAWKWLQEDKLAATDGKKSVVVD